MSGASLDRTGKIDFFIEVGKGNVDNTSFISFLGNNPTLGSSFETLWDEGGIFTFQTAGEALELVSDDTNDTSAGTGARTVLVTGLDDSYITQTETVTLNGTTPVATIRTDWFRINSIIVLTSGSSMWNEGIVTLRVASAGATRAKMLPTNALSFNGFFTVPAGKNILILQSSTTIPKNEDVLIKNRIGIFGSNTLLAGGDSSVYQMGLVLPFKALSFFPEKTDIRLDAKSTNVSVNVSLVAEMLLFDKVNSQNVFDNLHI